MTQQDADAAPDVVTGIISILDRDAYTLVDPGAMHSFASKPFLDHFQIETQPLEGHMRVSLLAGDPLFSDRVVKDSRVLIGGQEFPVDLIALDMRDFDVVLGMDWLSRHRDTVNCYKKEVKLHRSGKLEVKFRGIRRELSSSMICKTRENSNFLKNGKIVISVKKIWNFSKSQMTKRTSPLKSSREI